MQDYIETLTALNWNILLTAKHGELPDYVTNNQMLVNTFELDKNVLTLLTQGTHLSILGGDYPPVTSVVFLIKYDQPTRSS